MVGDTWEKKVAIKYYDKLYKEYVTPFPLCVIVTL